MRNRRRPNARAQLVRLVLVLRAALARGMSGLRALAARVAELLRRMRRQPWQLLEEEAAARPGPVQGADAALEGGDGRAQATTIVPSARWEGLDRALGRGRERWRNLATAAVAVVALLVAVSVLWSSGDDAPKDAATTADAALAAAEPAVGGARGLFPTMVFDDPAPADVELEPVGAFAPAEPLPDGLPSGVGYGGTDPVGASAAANPAPVAGPAPVVALQVPEPEPEPAREVDPEEAVRMAQAAGCPGGTLPTEVLPGDTVGTIAWRHVGLEQGKNFVREILAVNEKLRPERMQPGDIVCVPRVERVIVSYETEPYTIQRGDTIARMADRYQHLTRANLMALTTRVRKKDMLYAGKEVRLPMPLYATRL
jgi:hypothetical protein